MYRKGLEFALLVLVMLTFFLQACSPTNVPPPPLEGQVLALQVRSTLWSLGRAVSGAPGATTLMNMEKTQFVFGWTLKNAYAFLCLDTNGLTCSDTILKLLTSKGTVVNPKDMSQIAKILTDNGWQTAKSSDLPSFIKVASSAAITIAGVATTSLVTILIAPAGMLTPDFLEELEGEDYIG